MGVEERKYAVIFTQGIRNDIILKQAYDPLGVITTREKYIFG